MVFRKTLGVVLWLLILCVSPLPATAQQGADPERERPQNNSHLKRYPYVEDLTTKANDAIQNKHWSRALDVYVQAMDKYPDHLVPSTVDASLFVSVREYCLASMASWPDEGRQAYQGRFDPVARQAFVQARQRRDAAALQALVAAYPFSSVRHDALSLLANLSIDEHQPREAADYLNQLLVGPGDVPVASITGRLANCYFLLSDKKALEQLALRVTDAAGQERITIGDQHVTLSEYLRDLRQKMADAPVAAEPAATGWTMIGGNASATAQPQNPGAFPKLAWSVSFPQYAPRASNYDYYIQPSMSSRPFFPAVSDGAIYMHDGFAAYAFNLYTRGREPPLWTFKVQPVSALFEERVVYATTVHQGRVFVNLVTAMGDEERQLGDIYVKIPFPKRALFALDATTGKELWRIGGAATPHRFEDELSFSMAPTPDGDLLYVPAVRQIFPTDPFEHYVVCLDAATGKVRWSQFVASGLTEINLFGNSTREALPASISISGGTLFACTNVGAVAALDKLTGGIRWAYQYEQVPVPYTRSISIVPLPLQWMQGPPIATHGLFLFAPLDATHLFAVDQSTGRLRWKVRRPEDARAMLGVADHSLVVGGTNIYYYDLNADGKLIHTDAYQEGRGMGKGIVTPGGVYMPTDAGIAVTDPKTYKLLDWIVWSVRQGANITIAEQSVVATTQNEMFVYYDRQAMEKEVLAELSREVRDPDRAYRLAMKLSQIGRDREAGEMFQKTLELIPAKEEERFAQIRSVSARRLWNLHMKLGRERQAAGELGEAENYFQKALACSSTVGAAIETTLALGDVLHGEKKFREALQVYQQALQKHAQETIDGKPLWDVMRGRIEAALTQGGRELYQPYEREAADRKSKALAGKSVEALLEVTRLYPNARASEEAMLAVAGLQKESRQADAAAQTLRDFIRQFPGSDEIPQAMMTLITLLEEQKLYSSAWSLLTRLQQNFSEAKITDGNDHPVVREWVADRLKRPEYVRRAQRASFVKLNVPMTRAWTFERQNEEFQILKPFWQDSADVPVVFVTSAGKVRALARKDGTVAWEAALVSPVRLFVVQNRVIVAGYQYATCLNLQDGSVQWSYTTKGLLQRPVVSGDALIFTVQKIGGERGLDVTALSIGTGNTLWSSTFDTIASDLFPLGETVAFVSGHQPSQVILLDVSTGAVRHTLTPAGSSSSTAVRVLYGDDSVLCWFVYGQAIEAYNPATGKLLWRHALDNRPVVTMEAREGAIVYLTMPVAATSADRFQINLLSMESGKLVKAADVGDFNQVPMLRLSPDTIYLVSRKADQTMNAQALSMKGLEPLWSVDTAIPEPVFNALMPVATEEHLVMPYLVFDNRTREWSYRGVILDRTGKRVQLVSSENYARPPQGEVVGENLVIQGEHGIELFSGGH